MTYKGKLIKLGIIFFSIIILLSTPIIVNASQFTAAEEKAKVTGDYSEVNALNETSRSASASNTSGNVDAATIQNMLLQATGDDTGGINRAENVILIVNTLATSGFSDEAIAGALANFYHESAICPLRWEADYAYINPYGWQLYDQNKTGGNIDFSACINYGNQGCGIGQWTFGRHAQLSDYCKDNGPLWVCTGDWHDTRDTTTNATTYLGTAGTQMAFLLVEQHWTASNANAIGLSLLTFDEYKTITDATTAAKYWCANWETPKGWSSGVADSRSTLAEPMLSVVQAARGVAVSDLSSSAQADAQNMAVQNAKNGVWNEEQLGKFGQLYEFDWESVIEQIDRDNLDLQEIESLTQWENEVEQQKITPVKIARRIVAGVGIAMIMWSIFLYLAYWFDTINTIFPVSLVGILSFGKLEVLNEEETTWGMASDDKVGKTLTVNHSNILVICITLIAVGIFILSGSAYYLIQKLYSIAKHFYK